MAENESKVHYKSIKYSYQNPPLIGLINLDNTHAMNALLQCLSNIEQLTNYFKYDSFIKQIIKNKKNSLTASYKLIIDKLYPSNNNHNILFNKNVSFSPNDFLNKIYLLNPLFKNDQIYNLYFLFNFIIITLCEELKRIEGNYNNLGNHVDKTNEQLVLNNIIQYFKSSHNSIIADLFYGINENITTCLKCKNSNYNCDIYFFITFPLKEVWRFKISELYKNNTINQVEKDYKFQLLNKNIINIKDCFDYYKQITIWSGIYAFMECNICNQKSDSFSQTLFYTLPPILIIYLKKEERNQHKVKLIFNELLDLKDNGKNGGIYELISVITHVGNYDSSGHFIATCKSFVDNRWYRYNDAVVSEITNFEKDIIDFGRPELLFYKRQ